MADKGGFLKRALDKGRQAADALKDEYRKGKEGDESPVTPIGPTATAALKAWLAKPSAPAPAGGDDLDEGATADGSTAEPVPDADAVAGLLSKVDWRQVSSSITDSKAAQRMKDLAGQVDWQAARPAAARIGTALIAAAASGQLGGLQGRSGALVARTIINETGLAEKVADLVAGDRSAVGAEPLRTYIDATAREATPAADAFDANLADLGRAIGPGPTA